MILYCSLLVFYLLRRRRQCYDIPEAVWHEYQLYGEIFVCGYLCHYLPYFFIERTLFLHHYLPAFTFQLLLMITFIQHIYYLLTNNILNFKAYYLYVIKYLYLIFIVGWTCCVIHVFIKFIVLSYGLVDLSTQDILNLRWKDTWDFIIHRNV